MPLRYGSQSGCRRPNMYLIFFRRTRMFETKQVDPWRLTRHLLELDEICTPSSLFAADVIRRWYYQVDKAEQGR